ncbi:hypothetical protein MMC28_008478 [Mycoblastus sanguinarius]|nr:hypothetical protein [Mycoblastus sanguinarius]
MDPETLQFGLWQAWERAHWQTWQAQCAFGLIEQHISPDLQSLSIPERWLWVKHELFQYNIGQQLAQVPNIPESQCQTIDMYARENDGSGENLAARGCSPVNKDERSEPPQASVVLRRTKSAGPRLVQSPSTLLADPAAYQDAYQVGSVRPLTSQHTPPMVMPAHFQKR